jgi:hypothetical protein
MQLSRTLEIYSVVRELEVVASFIVTSELVRMNQSTTSVCDCLGGADRDRTDDPRLAKPVLSQLSYNPVFETHVSVGLARLELATLPLSGVRSNHLSYRP